MSEHVFKTWAHDRPDDLHDGQILLWRTKHKRGDFVLIFSGRVRSMHNGWTNTDHLHPPMTRWDGYRHLIPSDLQWAAAPDWILERATYQKTGRYGMLQDIVDESKVRRLIAVDGIELLPCPFCGGDPVWETWGGFIGASPNEDDEFSLTHCGAEYRRGSPLAAAKCWNRRPPLQMAAPDLLEAVEVILDAANDRLADGLGHELPPAVRAKLEAAVAKAKGGAS